MQGLYLLAAHFAGDWLLQSDTMATRKLENPQVRAVHVTIYTGVLTLVYIALVTPSPATTMGFVALVAIPHYVIDGRRWKDPVQGFESRPIWFDQVYHIVTLAVAVGILEVIP